MNPVEISNLPPEAYRDYDANQILIDRSVFESGLKLPPNTTISVNVPTFYDHLSSLIDMGSTRSIYPTFEPPPHYHLASSDLFSYLAVPFLTEDKKEIQMERVQMASKTDLPFEYAWEQKKEIEEETREKRIFTVLFEQLTIIDKDLVEINNQRGRYHKG